MRAQAANLPDCSATLRGTAATCSQQMLSVTLSMAAAQVIASAISKMVASTATYPHEVVRAHMHVAGSGPFAGFTSTCSSVRPCCLQCMLELQQEPALAVLLWQ